MKILFAPAKSFRDAQPFESVNMVSKQTLKLVRTIAKWSQQDIAKKFKISDELSQEVRGYYKNFQSNPGYVAIDFYYGESYKAFNATTLVDVERQFLNDHVFIIDALYGLIRPLDLIKPYRLDFTLSGLDLNHIWQPLYEQTFKGEIEPILSLASDEFTSKIKALTSVYEVHFIDCKKGKCKAISVFNKQQRGALLRYIVTHQIQHVSEVPVEFNGYILEIDGYRFNYRKLID